MIEQIDLCTYGRHFIHVIPELRFTEEEKTFASLARGIGVSVIFILCPDGGSPGEFQLIMKIAGPPVKGEAGIMGGLL